MNADRWKQVKAIFNEAVECEPARRAQIIEARCSHDDTLREEVESLLLAEQNPHSILDEPIVGVGVLASTTPVEAPSPMVGRTIGNYLITGELAHGGMGTVYRARHISLPREVVVKCIRTLLLSKEAQEELRARFRQEAHIQCQLDHPNIVRVYEFFEGDGDYFLVMEYVPGSSIRSMLDDKRVLPVEDVVALGIQALDGLAHAHSLRYRDEAGRLGCGIIHRDIKPANLLVDEQGRLKLTDFGIAKPVGGSELTGLGSSPGTIEYMSPEQIRRQPVDARSDLYSLGVTLYEMLTGRAPFNRSDLGSDHDVLCAHVEKEPRPIRSANPAVPPALAAVVTRALQKDAAQRWQTAGEFREQLRALHSGSAQAGRAEKPRRPSRRMFATAGVAAASLILAVAAYWLGRRAISPPPQPTVAVIPFVDMSADKNLEYFSDGLTEDLLNTLAKTPGMRVAGWTSSSQFKGKTGNFQEIGKTLHVDNVLEGSVRRNGQSTRITVQLIKTADGFQMWSETYDRNVDDIFAVEDEIAQAVTRVLKVKLLAAGKKGPARTGTNGAAYDAYLQGRYFLERSNRRNLEKAVDYFREAVNLDPRFAPGWAGLADAVQTQAGAAYISPEEGYKQARVDVKRGLALDPNLAYAHGVLGEIKMLHDWDWNGADAAFRRALALQPGNPEVMKAAGGLARMQGRLDEAIAYYRRAIDLDPFLGHRNLALNLYYAGMLDEAKATLNKTLEINPDTSKAHAFLSRVLLAQSQPQEALAEAAKEKDPIWRLAGLAMAHYTLGNSKGSDANLAELIIGFHADSPYQIAEVYAFRGQPDQAFQFLDSAYALHDPGLTEMKSDPLLRNIRKDSRYAALLRKMKL